MRSEHVDLAASLVAFDGATPVGFAVIARRGMVARVAAMGAVAAARNRGLGRALLDAAFQQARARGERRIVLEVIEQNAPARALYTRTGFVVARRLVGFRAPPLANEDARQVGERSIDERRVDERLVEQRSIHDQLEERPLDEVVRAYLADGDPSLPWQLAPATIAAMTAPTRAFALGPARALVDVLPAAIVVRAVVVPSDVRRRSHATHLLRALRAHFADRTLRVVPIVPEAIVGELPARVGATLDDLAQLELARDL
jgi:ribosomal protein S18 acetylase RimI-like enzyme